MRHLRQSILYPHLQALTSWLALTLLIYSDVLVPRAWYHWMIVAILFVVPLSAYQWHERVEAWRRLFCLIDGERLLRKRLTARAWLIHERDLAMRADADVARADFDRLTGAARDVGIETDEWPGYIQAYEPPAGTAG